MKGALAMALNCKIQNLNTAKGANQAQQRTPKDMYYCSATRTQKCKLYTTVEIIIACTP